MSIQVVLASQSSARLETLRQAGIFPAIDVSTVDEDRVLADKAGDGYSSQVAALAKAKALDVAEKRLARGQLGWGTLVIGCDSMFVHNGSLYGKPHDKATAFERIKRMSGTSGQLLTGHHVVYFPQEDGEGACGREGPDKPSDICSARHITDVSVATVHVGHMSDDEIEAYVNTGEPLEVAGSFTLEGFGGAFIDRVEGDHHGVIGLSLPLMRTMLKQIGVFWPDLWNEEGNGR